MIFDIHAYKDQFGFQRRHAVGKVLNVGSNNDGAGLGGGPHKSINVDLVSKDGNTGWLLPVNVLADARLLPFQPVFDSVVLGEILEHMETDDAVQTIREAKSVLKDTGRVVITMPHDARRERGSEPPPPSEFYAPGIFAYHHRLISRKELFSWVQTAGLAIQLWGTIEYVWGERGTGVVAC